MINKALVLSLAFAATGALAAAPKAAKAPVKPLIEAAGAGNLAEIDRLIKAGAPVNGRLAASDNGMTPLTVSAALGQAAAAKALLAAGAEVNLADALGDTPLHKACFPPTGKDLAAAANAKRSVALVLLAAKPKLNLRDKQGWTPLMLAASVGDAALVKALLDAGADASIKLSSGKTALALALQGGNKDAAYVLSSKK